MTHVTKEFHRVPPILFLSLRYFRRKPCTNHASRVALSPNGPYRASTWTSSPRSPIKCIQNDLYAYGTFGANRAPILHQEKHYPETDRSELPLEPHHIGVWSRSSKWFLCLWYVRCKPCSNLALTLRLSSNGLKRDSIGCVQNCLWPMVRSMQTVHLSSVALSPKGPNRSPPDPHHLGVPRVLLKQFVNLWYIWRKPSTYLAPTLTLFQNRSKQDSTWPT
jgi:hypothetical protein